MDPLQSIKELASLVQKIGDIELYRKIVELQGEIVKLSTHNFELEKKCALLQDELNRKKSMKHLRSIYVAEGDPVPFCPRCWETNNKAVHLFGPVPMMDKELERWECHSCHYDYSARKGEPFSADLNRRRSRTHQ